MNLINNTRIITKVLKDKYDKNNKITNFKYILREYLKLGIIDSLFLPYLVYRTTLEFIHIPNVINFIILITIYMIEYKLLKTFLSNLNY